MLAVSVVAVIWGAGSAAHIWAAALARAISAVLAGLPAAALRASTSPGGAATSPTADVSVPASVSGPAGITVSMTTGAATATPITIPTTAICPGTDVREHQRPHHGCVTGETSPASFVWGPVP